MKKDSIIALNTFYQIAAKFITALAGFVAALVIARSLGVSGYGVFALVTTYVSFFYLLCDFGLNAIYLQLDKAEAYFGRFLIVRLLLSIAMLCVANAAAFLFLTSGSEFIGLTSNELPMLLLFSITILTQAIIFTATALFQKRMQYFLLTITMSVSAIVMIGIIMLSAFNSATLWQMLFAYVAGGVSAAAIALWSIRKNLIALQVDWDFAKKLFVLALPLGTMLLLNLLYFRIDILLLSQLRGNTNVGVYSYAYRYFEFFLTIPLFLSNALYPYLLKRDVQGKKYAVIFLVLSLVVLVGGWIGAPILAFISSEFVESVTVFRVLLLSLPVFFLTSFLQWQLIAQKDQRFLLFAYALATVGNIFLNLYFIPFYGVYAAAVITGICELFVLVLLALRLRFTKFIRKGR